MPAMPNTREGLEAAGYKFSTKGKCKECHADIEWWVTPKSAWMPLDKDTLVTHWATCENPNRFRKKNRG